MTEKKSMSSRTVTSVFKPYFIQKRDRMPHILRYAVFMIGRYMLYENVLLFFADQMSLNIEARGVYDNNAEGKRGGKQEGVSSSFDKAAKVAR